MLLVVKIVCQVLLVLTSLLLIASVLLHKGKGGGLSDMFGGGFQSSVASSGRAERNLNMITIVTSVLWLAVIVILGFIVKFGG